MIKMNYLITLHLIETKVYFFFAFILKSELSARHIRQVKIYIPTLPTCYYNYTTILVAHDSYE